MGVPCRCINRIGGKTCFTRKTLAMKPEHYTAVRYQPKCPSCGVRHWMIDKYRIKVEKARSRICYCGGMHFVHRKGCKFCYHHPNAEQDHIERYEK